MLAPHSLAAFSNVSKAFCPSAVVLSISIVAATWLMAPSNSRPVFMAAMPIAPTAAAAAAVAEATVLVMVPSPLVAWLNALLNELSTLPAIFIAISISLPPPAAINLRHLLRYFYQLKNGQAFQCV